MKGCQQQQQDNNNTEAMLLAMKGIIPDEKYSHDPELKNNEGHTVCYYLFNNGMEIPEKWQDKQYKNPYKIATTFKNTQAMQDVIFNKKIPSKQNYHNPNITNNEGYTVAMYLAINSIVPPKQWEHNPELQSNQKHTVPMLLAINGIIPPKQWIHDPNIKSIEGYTTAQRLKTHYLPIPNEWYDDTMMNTPKQPEFVQQALYGQIPNKPDNIQSDYNCGGGWTIAMLLANNGVIPSQEWEHDPELQNDENITVALLLAKNKVIPPKQWSHDKYLIDRKGYTVQILLLKEKLQIPKYFRYQTDKNGRTKAMQIAMNGQIPNWKDHHNPNIIDINKNTVCYYLWKNSIQVPDIWQDDQYKKPFTNKNGFTNAMKQALQDQIPSFYNYHDPNIRNNGGYTVAMCLIYKNIIPPRQWYHKRNIINNKNQTVYDMLKERGMMISPEWDPQAENNKYNFPNKDKNNNTKAMLLAMKGQIPGKRYQHNPNIINNDQCTVCYYLWQNKIQVPEQWQDEQYINPLRDNQGRTSAIKQAQNNKLPDRQNYHNSSICDNYGNTVQMYLAQQRQVFPKEWCHDPKIQNGDGNTVAIILAQRGIIPDMQLYHDSDLQNNSGYTVALYLAQRGIVPPKYWQHRPEIQTINGDTVALLLAKNGIIPSKEWIHDPNIKNKNGYTVQYYLHDNNLPIPNEWYNENMKDIEKKPEFIQQALYGQVPQKPNNINNDYKTDFGYTVPMLLVYNKINNIPKEWEHDKYIANNKGQTVQYMLIKNNMTVPDEWECKIDDYQNTYTMMQILQNQTLNLNNYYDPNIRNKDGNTYAMLLAQKGELNTKQCIHDKYLCNNQGQTVQYIYYKNNTDIPEEWKYGDENGNTDAMLQAINGQIPSKEKYHDPNLINYDDHTVAYYLWKQGIQVPYEWQDQQYKNPKRDESSTYLTEAMQQVQQQGKIIDEQLYHDPNLISNTGNTVAHYISYFGIIPPKQWQHDKLLKNYINETVAIILSSRSIIPSEQWMHDINIQGKNGNSIKSNLEKYGYVYISGQFKINVQTEIKQVQCQICLLDDEREFIKTTCNHNICYDCYKELLQRKQNRYCPICRRENWILSIDQEVYEKYMQLQNNHK